MILNSFLVRISECYLACRIRCQVWKAASEALATEANKLKRGMHVTGMCNVCGLEIEDTAHVLFKCPHASRLWTAMRNIWYLPSDMDMKVNSHAWFQSVLVSVSAQMIDAILLVAWRVWFVRNEITHAKPFDIH
jgi:hypothetical protein